MRTINKEEIAQNIGYQAKPTPWFRVKQAQINQFADCTLDHQFIHVDEEKAKSGPFGTTIAHGFLSLSMIAYFAESFNSVIEGVAMQMNYGFDKVRFLMPVKVNSQIRAHAKILDIKEKKPGQFILITQVTIEIEGEDKPALIADWISLQVVA